MKNTSHLGDRAPAQHHLTVKQAASFLGVSEATLRRWDVRGVLRADRHPVNNYRRYRRDDLETFRRRLAGVAAPPAPADAFIGRDGEVTALAERVRGGARLITIVGPPGVGKTRLALELARLLEGDGPALFCDLSGASGVDDLYASVARALGVSLAGDDAAVDLSVAIAARGRLLIVLDNFEHLLPHGSHAIAHWVRTAPRASLLITSREQLGVGDEQPFALEALRVPAAATDVWVSGAGALFAARAAAARPGYEPSDADADAVGAIVRRLEGNPLAIELAAAEMGVRSAGELEIKLRDGVGELHTAHRDAPPRHATLRLAIEWSLGLLAPWERAALAQASAFRGGFTLPAAEAVIDRSQWPKAPPADAIVDALRRKSLVRAYEPRPGSVRFALYESVREIAAGAVDPDERAAAESRHARYFLDVAEAWGRDAARGRSPDPLHQLAGEVDNLVAVHHRATSADQALRAALALDPVLADSGPSALRLALLDAAIERTDQAPQGLVAGCLRARAAALRRAGRLAEARADLQRSIAAASASGDADLERRALEELAAVAMFAGDRSGARELLSQVLELHVGAGDGGGEGRVLNHLGLLAKAEDRFDEAERCLDRAASLFRASGDRRWEGNVLSNLGSLHVQLRCGDPLAEYDRAIGIAQAFGDNRLEGHALTNMANALHDRGRLDEAEHHYRLALPLLERTVDRIAAAITTGNLGLIAWERSELAQARDALDRAHEALAAADSRTAAGFYLALRAATDAGLDRIAVAEGAFARAQRALADSGSPVLVAAAELIGAHIDLARARAAERDSNVEAARGIRARVDELAERHANGPTAATSEDVRSAIRLLRARAAADAGIRHAPTLEIAADARWIRVGSGPPIDLSRRGPLRRLLLALARARLRAPGEPVSRDQLIAAGWPGEQPVADSGARRLAVTLSTLRNLGLRGMLVTGDGGYLLDPRAPVTGVTDLQPPRGGD